VERHGVELGQAALSGACHGLLEGKSAANVHEQNLQKLVGGGDLPAFPTHGTMLSGVLVQLGGHQVADDFPLVFDKTDVPPGILCK
jgi:hypothetical protein